MSILRAILLTGCYTFVGLACIVLVLWYLARQAIRRFLRII